MVEMEKDFWVGMVVALDGVVESLHGYLLYCTDTPLSEQIQGELSIHFRFLCCQSSPGIQIAQQQKSCYAGAFCEVAVLVAHAKR